jgi:TonB family protein
MKIHLTLFCLFISFVCAAQTQSEKPKIEEKQKATANTSLPQTTPYEVEFTMVEEMPRSDFDYQDYIRNNTRYPYQAVQNKIEGVVYVNFQVGPDGLIRDVKVTKGLGYGLDEEAVRLISEMPAWIPGKQAGKPRAVRTVLPVRFKLANK